MTHIVNQTIISSDDGFSSIRRLSNKWKVQLFQWIPTFRDPYLPVKMGWFHTVELHEYQKFLTDSVRVKHWGSIWVRQKNRYWEPVFGTKSLFEPTLTVLVRSFRTNLSKIRIKIRIISLKNMHLKMSSSKWWPFCLGLSVLTNPTRESFQVVFVFYNDM